MRRQMPVPRDLPEDVDGCLTVRLFVQGPM